MTQCSCLYCMIQININEKKNWKQSVKKCGQCFIIDTNVCFLLYAEAHWTMCLKLVVYSFTISIRSTLVLQAKGVVWYNCMNFTKIALLHTFVDAYTKILIKYATTVILVLYCLVNLHLLVHVHVEYVRRDYPTLH